MIEMLAFAAVVVFLVGIGLAILTTEVLRKGGAAPKSPQPVKHRRRVAAGREAGRGAPEGLSAAAAADLAIHNSYRASPPGDVRRPAKTRA